MLKVKTCEDLRIKKNKRMVVMYHLMHARPMIEGLEWSQIHANVCRFYVIAYYLKIYYYFVTFCFVYNK